MKFDCRNVASKVTVLLKPLILIIWYMILLVVSSIAYTEKASDVLEKISTQFVEVPFGLISYSEANYQQGNTPISYLWHDFSGVSPAHVILDLLNKTIPGWENHYRQGNNGGNPSPLNEWQKEQYFNLFISFDNFLESYLTKKSLSLDSEMIDKSVVTHEFRKYVTENEIHLPDSAKQWIATSVVATSETENKTSLADTFLVLVVLGVFGSLIFLTKDLLSSHDANSVLAYIFRPVFGMALSIAVFIVAILAHSVMTTAPLEDIRTETMYILGLGAGILADTAYNYLKNKAEQQFDEASQG
ncbi:hypothetical protein Q6U64_004429 [Vibrio vulnificus]|uniref:Uncharacterized protein n=1 Tax=Vibrio vulnificus TaxID=672 RepID=A0AAW4HIQ5_VIBVL|nr:hypothetical protein [Vibrio vulnificus]EJU9868675.1 hypothetical protein [Vibrio vulnificus]ELA3118114.1 hypothetical protein [Vibrio vulnificus]ELL0561909.1 hypothetical protein [Vibrio vulnificus]ELV8768363.1 hypothetical protein [Vibrio vulnificus]MBN8124486.1 hypothetical protein [Vibrio vulnificus]